MCRKIFSVMILAAALVFIGNQAEAREVYVDSYSDSNNPIIFLTVERDRTSRAREVYVGSYSDGTAVYVLTGTIQRHPRNTSLFLRVTVRAGGDYLEYMFEPDGRRIMYVNSEGYRGYIDDGYSPVAKAIYNYCMN